MSERNGELSYWSGLSHYVGSHWNQFWFTPSSPRAVCRLRILVGVWALFWQLSFTSDLQSWFGPQGWLDGDLYRNWVLNGRTPFAAGRFSYLFAPSPAALWGLHVASSLILLAFAAGLFTRITSVLALGVVLAYIHRAPFLGGSAEPVLTMLVGYLCLAPSGRLLSLDQRIRSASSTALEPSAWATLAIRLMQVHLAMVYLAMVATKLAGVVWWNGESVWWLAVQPSSGVGILEWLRAEPVLINIWTFGVLLSELAMLTLVWNRWFRPLVLGISALSWLSVAVASGNWPLAVTMILANLVYVESE